MYSSQLSNFQILVVAMPSDMESDLAKSLSDLKEELRSGFSSLKRELVEENSLAIKKLRSTALSTPKLKKKGNEKQFEANSQVLDNVQSASSFLAATPPQVEKAVEELKEAFQNPYTGSWPISSPGLRGRSCFACGKFGHFRSQCPVLSYQPSANEPNKRV